MLPPHIEGLTEAIQINERFKITVKTYQDEGYAPSVKVMRPSDLTSSV